MTGGTAAVQGIAMLNPQRWGSTNVGNGYSKKLVLEKDSSGMMLFDEDEEEGDEDAPRSRPPNCKWGLDADVISAYSYPSFSATQLLHRPPSHT